MAALVPADHALYQELFTTRHLVETLASALDRAKAKSERAALHQALQAGENVRAVVGDRSKRSSDAAAETASRRVEFERE